MKTTQFSRASESAMTLAETGVAVGVLMLLGLAFFQVLNAGLIASAKNVAVNSAHEEARMGVLRMTRDIHAAISVPQLRDNNFTVISTDPVSGVAPTSACVSFQNIASGPNFVWKDPGNPDLIMVKDNPKPVEGQRLIIPFFGLEEDITKVAAAGSANHSNVFIKSDQSTPNITAPDFGSPYAITYYTDRAMYAVRKGQYIPDTQGLYTITATAYTTGNWDRFALVNGKYIASDTGVWKIVPALYTSGSSPRYRFEDGELHLFKQRYNGSGLYWEDSATVARYISSPQPFYIPLNGSGSANTKYVGVKLTARDPKSSNRGYLSTATLLDTQVDYRSRLTIAQ